MNWLFESLHRTQSTSAVVLATAGEHAKETASAQSPVNGRAGPSRAPGPLPPWRHLLEVIVTVAETRAGLKPQIWHFLNVVFFQPLEAFVISEAKWRRFYLPQWVSRG